MVEMKSVAESGTDTEAVPRWKDPEMLALAKELGKYLQLALAMGFVYFGVIRPLIKAVAPPPAETTEEEATGAAAAEGEGEEGEDAVVNLSGAHVMTFEEKLAHAHELAKTNPKLVANLLKEWMGSEKEAKK